MSTSSALESARAFQTTLERAIAPAAMRARDAHERAVENESQWNEFVVQLDALDAREDPGGAFEALVELGGDVRVRAVVRDAAKVFVDVGLGFMAEMTREEARARATRGRAEAAAETVAAKAAWDDAEARVRTFESGIRRLIELG